MYDFSNRLFDPEGFPPRWTCGTWTDGLGWLHILSDLGVWAAYVAIPCVLAYFLLRRRDVLFPGIFVLFGGFILACGTTHLMDAIIFWWPAYRLAGLIKLFTALISWLTVCALIHIVPRALALRSPEELQREIAGREKVEAALRVSEARFRAAFDHAGIGSALVALDGRWLKVNRSLCDLLGRSEADLLASDFQSITHPGDLGADLDNVRRLLAGEIPHYEMEKRYILPDARVVWGHLSVALVPDAEGKPAYFVSLIQDITKRKETEAAIHLRDRALEAFNQGVCITDANQPGHPILYVNAGFERLTGYASREILGRSCKFLQGPASDPAAVGEVRRAIREGKPCLVELLNYRKDGTPFWNALSLAPVHDETGLTHFVGVQTDISPFKRLEEQYRQAQKMEAIGHLAGGIAHDFNNLLTVINGFTEMVLRPLPPADRNRPLLEEVLASGGRAADLTRQLLAFSRQQVLQPRVLELNDLIVNLQKMLGRLIGEDVRLATTLHPRLGMVKVDPGQMEQVLMNLAVNARDAMPTGGLLTIETSDVRLDESCTPDSQDVRPGRYAMLAVSDNGTGMDRDTLTRIFEPFFTTKEVGKGTGLGLATVFGIVKQSGGHVRVYSEVGRGTTFKVYLPAIDDPAGEPAPAPAPAPGGSQTVLVVEDEVGVRALTRGILAGAGYSVLEASDGHTALGVYEKHRGGIDLLVTDVVMPAMGGRELAGRLSLADPRLKVLYLSGYTDDAVVRHGVLENEVAFLQKPFTMDGLIRKVYEILNPT